MRYDDQLGHAVPVDVPDLDNDGLPEIIVCTLEGFIRIFEVTFDQSPFAIEIRQDTDLLGGNLYSYYTPIWEVAPGTFCNSPYDKFEVWQWSGSTFIVNYSTYSGVSTHTVTIADADGDPGLEVVISGSVYPENKKDKNLHYLEIFDWDGTLNSIWNFIRTYPTVRGHGVG